jgi:hypothetical protein
VLVTLANPLVENYMKAYSDKAGYDLLNMLLDTLPIAVGMSPYPAA